MERDGKLHVQGVNQTQLVTPRPRAVKKSTDIVALDRSSGERLESRLDIAGLEVARTMQSS